MAYVHLLDLYKHIDERLGQATDGRDKAGDNLSLGKFEQGRIDALAEFREFLIENFNPKLPRRIRNAYFGPKN